MSAFLGQIHYQMYDRIKTAASRSASIYYTFHEKYGDEIEKVCGFKKEHVDGWVDETPLDELIGDNSIHGWLASKIDEVETREGVIVNSLVKKYGKPGEELALEAAFWHGKGKGLELSAANSSKNINELFGIVFSSLLDGMPCDNTVTNSKGKDNSITSRHSDCIHLYNWEKSGANPILMCAITRRWIDGLCESLSANFSHTGCESIVSGASECVDIYSVR